MSGSATGSSYKERAINCTISLGEGAFGTSGQNSVKLSGLRVSATIQKRGPPSFDTAEITIYGLPPTIMNQVSTLGIPLPMTRPKNTVLLEAGDVGGTMAVVFFGEIGNAWQDLDGMPETFFQIVCWTGAVPAMAPVSPISVEGGADVATMMSGIARTMGYSFENSGVQAQLANPYFAGTALEQAHKLATAANIELYIDSGTSPPTLAIWPKTGTRNGTIPVISPESGLIGYPKFRDYGMDFRCLFNPSLRVGGTIQMQSSIKPASGLWYVNGPLTYQLSAQLPGGPWFCAASCGRRQVPASS